MIKKKKINIGIVGAGSISDHHLKVYKSYDFVNLTAIYSRTEIRAKEKSKKFGIKYYTNSIKKFLKYSTYDGILILVSADQISKFVKKSKNADLEKAYINKFFSGQLVYLYKDPKIDNLELSSNCNILISTISTLLREAFSMGTKIISLNTLPFSHSLVYEKISFKSFPDFNEFSKEINHLMNISRKEYFEKFDLKDIEYNSLNGKTAIQNIAKILENNKFFLIKI